MNNKISNEKSMLFRVNVRIMIFTLIIAIITLGLSFLFTYKLLEVIIGMIAGMLIAMIRMYTLNENIKKEVQMDVSMARKAGTFNYVLRYLLTGVALVGLVLYSPQAFIGAVIIIIFATKFAVYSIKVKNGDFSRLNDIDKQIEEEKKQKENQID